ncbi:hypothetical protein HHL19_16015 [Streptomyces sp. R302]|uniref:hypothetical protein n=1 Tax=unclassified Streptomyces TaxID=2593676 RepID=UPI00145E461F|nr:MULTISPECIES: hypothetical protein [unclassified Streptomyces]NML51572.1 hypothetical protein [Streptomyces sp. R301]NML80150.1 hypothetical protein [Streptomyces sp. R302]
MTGTSRHGEHGARWRLRVRAALIGIGGLIALAAGVLLLVTVPRAAAVERALQEALVCRGSAAQDCVRTAWFTVESVRIHRGKGSGGWVVVSGTDEAAGETRFSGITDFLDQVRPGDRVVGNVWRGRIIVLGNDRAAQRTDSHPVGDAQFAAGTGTALLLLGGLGVHVSRWSLRHQAASAWQRSTALRRTGWAVSLLSAWSFFLPMLLRRQSADLSVYFALWTPAALAAATFLARARPGRRTAARRRG